MGIHDAYNLITWGLIPFGLAASFYHTRRGNLDSAVLWGTATMITDILACLIGFFAIDHGLDRLGDIAGIVACIAVIISMHRRWRRKSRVGKAMGDKSRQLIASLVDRMRNERQPVPVRVK